MTPDPLGGEAGSPAQWIAGIGASAGGLDALVRLVSAAPTHTPVALVVIQHLSPDHKSLMPELLARRTSMPVALAETGMTPNAGTVYVMPPQQDLTLEEGRFRLWPRREGTVHHPINMFFESLSNALGTRAIGVVLSGTGRDGTQGALAIHAAGGLVYVQEPSTAGFEGMPTSAIEAGIADAVLAPEKILEAVCRVCEIGPEPTGAELEASALRTIIALLSRRQHIDFTVYKTGSLKRRAERRCQELGYHDLSEYVAYLVEHPEELERLAREVLIGVSSFFRDPDTFALLEESELPRLIRASDFDGTLRAWSVGCSTGQEPYSIAMLLVEGAEALGYPAQIKVFATDVDPLAIERAGAGVFPQAIQDELRPSFLSRFFHPTHEGYRVDRGLRQAVIFSVHNALRDPPYSRLDLVTCRNLLIYLQPAAQRDLLARLAVALKPGGILVLGSSETLGDVSDAFDVVNARARIYRRRPGRLRADLYGAGVLASSGYRRAHQAEIPEQRRVLDEAYRTLARLDSPVSLVLNPIGQVIHTTGDVKEFLSIPVGSATLDIVQMARGSLSTLLATSLAVARRDGKVVEYTDVEVLLDEQPTRMSVRIVPLDPTDRPHHLVSLRRTATKTVSSPETLPIRFDASGVEAMQLELSSTRENLHSAIEELETTNEELQATNEEMLASNEELQATNEELQATNEELATTNAESERRIQDLVELNADMEGLLRSTEIGTLFLDEQLAIRKFTPLVATVVSLMDRDVGRPIEHVRHSLGEIDLARLARKVLDENCASETPARSGERHFLLKAVPYELRGRVRGVVISFVEVSELVAVRDRLAGVLESLPEQVAVLDAAGTVVAVNRAWLDFGLANGGSGRAADAVGHNYLTITERAGTTEVDALTVAEGLRGVLAGTLTQFSTKYRCDAPWEERHFFVQVRSLGDGRGAVVSHVDVTPLARMAIDLQDTAALYQRLFTMSGEPLLVIDPTSATIIDCNPASTELLGSPSERLVSTPVFQVLRTHERSWESLLADTLAHGVVEGVEVTAGRASTEFEVHVGLHAIASHRRPAVLLRVLEPLTEKLLGERAALRTRLTQAQKMEALGLLAGGVAHELNNVLTAILSVVYAGRQDLASGSPLAEDLDAVISACRRGADLTRNLLGFARSGSIARERFELANVASEVVGLIERTLAANVHIQFRPPTDRSPTVLGDRSQVAQALMNLCMNAIDAVRGSGRISVEVGTQRLAGALLEGPKHAFLRVSDDGVGMDDATRLHAFDPFFTTKPRGEGTGLGLSMVYGVARSHGGHTDLESREGGGTTVTMWLPLSPESTEREAVAATTSGTGERILVVDDDDLVRRSLTRMLERKGYIAESASGGSAAIARVRDVTLPSIQFVLLDVSMPELDGIQTHAELRTTHASLPVLFYSGYADQAPGRKLELDDRTGFCSKPIDPDRLTHLIRMSLRGERLPSFAPAG